MVIPKRILPLYRHLWCSELNRRRQRLFRNISLLYLVETRLNPTIIRIKRQERNYYRLLKVWKMRLTSCSPALDMLTLPLVSLSKPVGPFNELGTPWRTVNELNPDSTQWSSGSNLSMIFFKEHLFKRTAKLAFIRQRRKKFVYPCNSTYFRTKFIPKTIYAIRNHKRT